MTESYPEQIKLVAMDGDDLNVISALCQDAVLNVGDMEFLPAEKRFVLSMNRFAWEKSAAGERKDHERRLSIVHFEGVENVKVMGINRKDKDTILSLLAIRFEPSESPAGEIEMVFSGDGAIKLQVECIEAQLADLGGAWSAKSQPDHQV